MKPDRRDVNSVFSDVHGQLSSDYVVLTPYIDTASDNSCPKA